MSLAAHGPAPRRTAPPRPRLSVVPPQPWQAPRAPFVLLVLALLVGGLLALLLLNTTLAQGAFVEHDLEKRSAALADREQALQQQVAVAESPDRLAAAARTLGMVPSGTPAFLRTSDGRVLGVPEPGRAAPRPGPTPPPTPAATPAATRAASPAPKLAAKPGAKPAPAPTTTPRR